ncbi:JNK-interacting protein 3 isoform X2 [Chrysoperla carnea]|uniref:JNK-interacting protein 3 isoform X2 n=1 Tax=Chrysoperla carnea TaxID=189513 RepID=UPI001D082397|nr:JNK-interacting protein 3 isoform X2 [Chrysoperla carnea]
MELDDSGGGLGAETIYGTHEDSHVVMSEKVQSLAGSIYQEFERMIARYDEDVVKTLMPLLVNVLECLDAAYQVNQEHDVELELLREDNEQLVTQYEREKGARKAAEQKLLEIEDVAEGERKEQAARQESLESIMRMLELKHKNSLEHACRLEEREAELKKEYAKLHDRYTELFKTHMDYMERTKLLLSGGQLSSERAEVGSMRGSTSRLQMGRSSGPVSFGFASLEAAGDGMESVPTSPISSCRSSPSLHSEMDQMTDLAGGAGMLGTARSTMERSQETDAVSLEHRGTATTPRTPPTPATPNAPQPPPPAGRSQTKREQRSANTLYQELSFQDADALADMDEGADITGGYVHPGEYASSGMGKEVENLIMENNELLATKNALNIVKDDLIVKVDELTSEQEMLREEIRSLNVARDRLKARVSELEEDLKKVKEANEARAATANNEAPDEEADIPMAQRKRFTRVEMARVLMERNQYKERFMELQEAVRWTEMIRASRNDPLDKKSKQSIWKFFSNLFSSNDRPERPLMEGHLRYHAPTNSVAPGVRALTRPGQDFLDTDIGSGSERLVARRAVERREQYKQVRAHVRKEDGRLQAYGWSLPGKVSGPVAAVSSSGNQSKNSGSGGTVPVPVPVYCRPLAETTPGMKIWCAAGVNLMGGHTKDGGLMVGGSVFYSDNSSDPIITEISNDDSDVANLDRELSAGRQAALLETQLSSFVWICTSTKNASMVTVIDANNPAVVLDTFNVCDNHLLCIASVAGASPSDYLDTSEIIKPTPIKKEEGEEQFVEGEITFVENAEAAPSPFASQATESNEDEEQSTKVEEKENEIETSTDTANTEEDSKNDTNSVKDDEKKSSNSNDNVEMSSVLATMWLGTQNGALYVHSAVANWRYCLHSVKLQDAVLAIVQMSNRVVTALADGTVAVFRRDSNTGQWNLQNYHLVRLGGPTNSVRCLTAVTTKVWCGYRNRIHVLDPQTLTLVKSLEAHPRKESQVRQLAWFGEGVWVSIRLDSTLRLYHAHTYQHLQDVDIEPYVSKMLGTGKLGFSFVRITALLISSNRLWIGTGNGVIISVPLSENSSSIGTIAVRGSATNSILPGGVRISPAPGNFIPYCTMAHAQLSFHGHRDSVKFFVAVPGCGGMSAASSPANITTTTTNDNHSSTITSPTSKMPAAMLVMSGGEGYIDFRIGDGDMEDSVVLEEVNESNNAESASSQQQTIEQKGEKSHLIVWQVSLT